jgi:hypothetical protein
VIDISEDGFRPTSSRYLGPDRPADPPDPPRRLKPEDLADRYGISRRVAGEWIRAMVAAGIARKLGRWPMGRLSACDAWVASGGESPKRRHR